MSLSTHVNLYWHAPTANAVLLLRIRLASTCPRGLNPRDHKGSIRTHGCAGLHPELGQPPPEALRAWLEQTADDLAVSVISCLEVAQLVKRGILDLPLSLHGWLKLRWRNRELPAYRSPPRCFTLLLACPTCIATLRIALSLRRHIHAMRFWLRRMASSKIIRTYAGYGRCHRHELGG